MNPSGADERVIRDRDGWEPGYRATYLRSAVRQQFIKVFYRVFRNASELIAEPGERIDSGQLTRSNDAPASSQAGNPPRHRGGVVSSCDLVDADFGARAVPNAIDEPAFE